MSLKNKRILITSGPTWVAIDPVRVISNIATGQTGKIIARLAKAKGAQVTLVLGEQVAGQPVKGVRVRYFRYFEQLRSLLKREIKKNKFDCVIHNAAVSDFLLQRKFRKKIESGKKSLVIRLKKAPKIINEIRKGIPRSLLVMFKLESGCSEKELVKRSLAAQKRSGADIVVANKFSGVALKSLIYNHRGLLAKAESRQDLAEKLISVLERRL